MNIKRGLYDFFNGVLRKSLNAEIVRGPLQYNQDGLASKHNCDFMRDDRFAAAYAKGERTGSWAGAQIHWRAHVVGWAARNGLSIEGDFVECGVNKGGLASFVLHYTELYKTGRKFWLLDTYNGLVEKYLSGEEHKRGDKAWGYEECYESVKNTFRNFPDVMIVRGEVPATLPQVTSTKIAFLGLDMNCMEPEIAAARFFWSRLSRGAMIVLDDYGWNDHVEQKRAFDEFARERGTEVMSLPTGQGLILKLT